MRYAGFILGLLFFVCSCLYFPENSQASEEDDFNKILVYAKDIGSGFKCINEKELGYRMRQVSAWIDVTAPHKATNYRATFMEGVTYYSLVQDNNPNAESCSQILENWNKITWPDVQVEEASAKEGKTGTEDQRWECRTERSKMDSSANVFCRNESVDKLLNSSASMEEGVFLVRCKGNSTDAFIVWPNFLGIRSKLVEVKIDDKPIEKTTWSSSEDGKAVFRNNPVKWLKSLRGAKRMIVRLAPYQKTAEELEFNITGINDVIDQVSEACKWKK